MVTDKSGWVVGKVLVQQARARGDQPFIQYEDGAPYTYAQAHAMANRVGNAFGQEGVAFGDPVAVMLHNRLAHLWTWFGLNRLGAVYVGINTASKGRFLTHVLACLVFRPGTEPPTPEAILDFCVARMPYFAVLRYLEYLAEIPKTPTQKIQKNRLRERGLSAATWDRESVGYTVRR